ncbi:fumarate hydratase [Mucilaginibacter segetis]|uniref:Fumarate hydratase n=1 Tax=Mucilaginibacter segetis TaxID=2793071 RepID=A0A934UN77_9SPHI|nr:fumarate hydratase [Mucilaginibacter segetis]MBK0379780.1 fumarate hydratase [Mucilaginibacter segetis]
MQKTPVFVLLAVGLMLSLSCRFNPDMQTLGTDYLQGEWQQDSISMEKQLVNYSLYHFKFSCDSFFVSVQSFSKTNPGADTCYKSGHWAEYAKGDYYQKSDTLHLKGLFCNADMSYKEPGGCFRSGVYEEEFVIGKKTDSLIQFNPTSSVIPLELRLIKKSTCIPKPL